MDRIVAKKPVKKAVKKQAAKKQTGKPQGKVVLAQSHASLIAVCRTDGCAEKGAARTFTVPKQGSLVMLPARVLCACCERECRVDWEDVHVERM